jgi:hypothetical protein
MAAAALALLTAGPAIVESPAQAQRRRAPDIARDPSPYTRERRKAQWKSETYGRRR